MFATNVQFTGYSNGDRMNSLSYGKTGLIFEHSAHEWPILSHYEYRSMEVWCPGNQPHIFFAEDIEEWNPATYFYDWFGPAKNNTLLFIQMQWPSVGLTSVWIHTTNETNSQLTKWCGQSKWGGQKKGPCYSLICSAPLHGGWGLLGPVVPSVASVIVVVVSGIPIGRFVWRSPERGGPHEEHDHRQDDPGHRHHGKRVVGPAPIRSGQLTVIGALVVCAVGLGLAE